MARATHGQSPGRLHRNRKGHGAVQGQTVLIVDDDPDLVQWLARAFSREGAQVYTAADGQAALRQLYACHPDLIILDIVMPVLDGWQTLARLRQFSHVPVIVLSVLQDEEDIVRGLEHGAVDYVTKPFSMQVLLARARAALRRVAPPPEAGERFDYDDGYLRVDPEGHRVVAGGKPVDLTATEHRLLACLVEHAGRALTSQQILQQVWGWEYAENPEYVHAYIWRLRQKLEPDPGRPAYLVTRRGVGYCLERQARR